MTPITQSDSSFLESLFSNADVRQYYVLRDDHAQNINLFTQYMVSMIQQNRSLQYIVRLNNGTPIGIAGGEIVRDNSGQITWNTSYAILPEYRNQGYATEAVIGFTDYLMNFNISKTFLDISDDNIPSKKVAEKAGYKYNKDTAHFDPEHMDLGLLFHWEKMLRSQRDNYFGMAVNAFRQKDYRGAESYFEKALQEPLAPGSPCSDAQIYSNMGIACSSYGNYRLAYTYLKKAQSLGLTNPSIERELNWLRTNKGIG